MLRKRRESAISTLPLSYTMTATPWSVKKWRILINQLASQGDGRRKEKTNIMLCKLHKVSTAQHLSASVTRPITGLGSRPLCWIGYANQNYSVVQLGKVPFSVRFFRLNLRRLFSKRRGDRVVKVLDLRSSGLCPRRFESCPRRQLFRGSCVLRCSLVLSPIIQQNGFLFLPINVIVTSSCDFPTRGGRKYEFRSFRFPDPLKDLCMKQCWSFFPDGFWRILQRFEVCSKLSSVNAYVHMLESY